MITERAARRSTSILVVGCIAALLLIVPTQSALAVPGQIDLTFSLNGWVATDFGSGVDPAFDVAISETDGRIVVVGRTGGSGGRIAIAAYDTFGVLDGSFSDDGKLITNLTSGNDAAYAVAIQPDGKIVVAGSAAGSGGRVALLRYEADGTPDAGFSGDGRVLTDLTPGGDYAWAVAIQPLDQKIVVAGGAGGAGGRFLVARYHPNGAVDTSFGNGGRRITDLTSGHDYVDAIAIQPDGKIVAAGSTDYFGSAPRFALIRYQANGKLDGTFSGDGKVKTNFPDGYAWAFGVALQPDGKIVAAGQAGSNAAIARYTQGGALDTSFSSDGKRVVDLSTNADYADEVLVQADGRIVIVGVASFNKTDSKLGLARVSASGSFDTSFGIGGTVVNNFSSGAERATAAVLQPSDGNIVLAGRTGGRFLAARYLVA